MDTLLSPDCDNAKPSKMAGIVSGRRDHVGSNRSKMKPCPRPAGWYKVPILSVRKNASVCRAALPTRRCGMRSRRLGRRWKASSLRSLKNGHPQRSPPGNKQGPEVEVRSLEAESVASLGHSKRNVILHSWTRFRNNFTTARGKHCGVTEIYSDRRTQGDLRNRDTNGVKAADVMVSAGKVPFRISILKCVVCFFNPLRPDDARQIF